MKKPKEKRPDYDKITRARDVAASLLNTELDRTGYDRDSMMGIAHGALNVAIWLAIRVYGKQEAAAIISDVVNEQLLED